MENAVSLAFKMPFLIIDLDDDYSYTVIGIPSRKHVWIMSRDPIMNDETYEGFLVDSQTLVIIHQ